MDEWEEYMYDRGGHSYTWENEYDDGNASYHGDDNIDDDHNIEDGESEPENLSDIEDESDIFTRDIDEDIDFRPDFRQMQQLKGDKGLGTASVSTLSKNNQKAMRSAEDAITEQLRGIISSDIYSSIPENKKDMLISKAEMVKNIMLLNLEVLINSLIWLNINNKDLNKKNFAEFIKRYEVTDPVTLLTYIRMLNK